MHIRKATRADLIENAYKELAMQLEHAINETPSGMKRDSLCNANILFIAAYEYAEEAYESERANNGH